MTERTFASQYARKRATNAHDLLLAQNLSFWLDMRVRVGKWFAVLIYGVIDYRFGSEFI